MANHPTVRVLFRGVLWGLVGVLLGSLIFGLIASPMVVWERGRISLSYSSAKWDTPSEMVSYFLGKGTVGVMEWVLVWVYWSLLTGGIGAIGSIIPGTLAGAFLSLVIHSRVVHLSLRQRARVILGMTLGALAGMLVGIFVSVPLLVLYNATGLLTGYLVLAFIALFVTIICGIFVGWRLTSGYSLDVVNG